MIGAIVGDFFFGQGDAGIGQLLRKYANNLDGEELFTAVIMSSLLGVAVFLFFGWLQHRIIGKWSEPSGPHDDHRPPTTHLPRRSDEPHPHPLARPRGDRASLVAAACGDDDDDDGAESDGHDSRHRRRR